MKISTLLGTITESVVKKNLIFYNESEEGKNIKRREWKNFEFGEQLSTSP
jgi:hypothetical protein